MKRWYLEAENFGLRERERFAVDLDESFALLTRYQYCWSEFGRPGALYFAVCDSGC